MDVFEAIAQRRSIRRFAQRPIARQALSRLVEAARLSPTGVNRQPLKLAVVSNPALCAEIFPLTLWAGRIPDGSAGPTAETQPAAYVFILVDKSIAQKADTDAGAAAMSMLLAAQAQGIASCWLGSIKRTEILALLGLSADAFCVHTAIALGYPAMTSRAVPIEQGNTDYYLESADSLCVPKRSAEEIARYYE